MVKKCQRISWHETHLDYTVKSSDHNHWWLIIKQITPYPILSQNKSTWIQPSGTFSTANSRQMKRTDLKTRERAPPFQNREAFNPEFREEMESCYSWNQFVVKTDRSYTRSHSNRRKSSPAAFARNSEAIYRLSTSLPTLSLPSLKRISLTLPAFSNVSFFYPRASQAIIRMPAREGKRPVNFKSTLDYFAVNLPLK